MTILSQKQLSLAEIYSDCTHFFESDKHHFLSLLEENLNLHALIPHSFISIITARMADIGILIFVRFSGR